jgi:hypothetical protein
VRQVDIILNRRLQHIFAGNDLYLLVIDGKCCHASYPASLESLMDLSL